MSRRGVRAFGYDGDRRCDLGGELTWLRHSG
jgi:hypothetical protein